MPTGLPINDIALDPEAPDRVIYLATDFGIYHTDNGGDNWHKVVEIPNVPIPQLRLRKKDRTLFAFTHGRGIWYLELKANLSSVSEVNSLKINIYPNPVSNGLVKISCEEQIEDLKIYDLKGKDVKSFTFNSLSKELEVSNLVPGIYFIKCSIGNQKHLVEKLIIK